MGKYTSNSTANAKIREDITESKRNQKIRELYATGSYSYRSLGKIYKRSHTRIYEIVNTPALDDHGKGEAING